MSRDTLHDELRALAVDWPATPDLPGRLDLGGGEPEPRRAHVWPHRRDPARRPWGALRTATAIAAALVIAVAAVPPARSAVLDCARPDRWREHRADAGRGACSRRRALRSRGSDLDRRRPCRGRLPGRRSRGAGTARVYLSRTIPGGMVSLAYGRDAVLSQFRGGATPYIRKLAGPGTRVRSVDVGGARGYFVSGAPPVVLFRDRAGRVVEGRPLLEGGSVLIWDAGGVAHRLELHGGLARALAIARSLP